MIFARLWGAWLLAFVLIESAALYHGEAGDTFSEFIWTFLAGGWARVVLVGGFMLWLTFHILLRGKWG